MHAIHVCDDVTLPALLNWRMKSQQMRTAVDHAGIGSIDGFVASLTGYCAAGNLPHLTAMYLHAVRAGQSGTRPAAAAAKEEEEEEDDEAEAARLLEARWPRKHRIADTLRPGMRAAWEPAMSTLAKAGRAFDGLEALLGGGAFDLQVQLCPYSCA